MNCYWAYDLYTFLHVIYTSIKKAKSEIKNQVAKWYFRENKPSRKFHLGWILKNIGIIHDHEVKPTYKETWFLGSL